VEEGDDDGADDKENSLKKINNSQFNIPETFPLITKHH
jgi:hypothetical protein